jgi:protein-S-isoprenylcysteine O-methyltransferase Ste14
MLRLYARGIRVLAVDRQRTPRQILEDLLALGCLLVWSYELVAYAWPLQIHLVPPRVAMVLFDSLALKITGALLMSAGLAMYGLGTRGLGGSWRLGIDRKTPGPLMTNGVFSRTRNPIYVSFDLLIIGTFLTQGRLHFLLLALTLAAMMHLQIRREEQFLIRNYGDAYRSYCASVGRYVTWPWTRDRA